ncbi:DUF4129 domain-containing protein [Aerosakkonemataceae cyanobacterium BLCC-F154]|uniref:DUF4129 domain-containing protein n=1 Tax=Floridaenema fluviatile BLCC-F154 TaxID=3153640 RepID=A0ABV4Y4G4_9CYAN
MAAESFEKTNLGWEFQQQMQRFNEWFELLLSRNQTQLPEINWSPELLEFLWLLVRGVFWVMVGLLLVWLGRQIWQNWKKFYDYVPGLENSVELKTTSINKLKVSNWIERSRKYYRQGNYKEAVRCLYMAMLQRLNDRGIILDETSRTDGEYRQLIQNLPNQQAYQLLLNTHEQLCFANSPISLEIFERCQQAYQEIEKQ